MYVSVVPEISFVIIVSLQPWLHCWSYIGGWAEKFIWLRHIRWGWIFDKWDPNCTTTTEEVCGLQRGLSWRMNLIWPRSIRVSCMPWNFQPIRVYHLLSIITSYSCLVDDIFNSEFVFQWTLFLYLHWLFTSVVCLFVRLIFFSLSLSIYIYIYIYVYIILKNSEDVFFIWNCQCFGVYDHLPGNVTDI